MAHMKGRCSTVMHDTCDRRDGNNSR